MASRKRVYSMTTRAAAAAQTRERILGSAFALFKELPYEETTLQRIAEMSGVSTQTVLIHFGSKDGLVDAIVEWWRPQEESLREVAPGDVDAAARQVVARYEDLGAATMRMLALEDRVDSLRRFAAVGRASHRGWVERTFAEELRGIGAARERRTMQLVAAFDVYTWHVLRRSLSAEETARAIAELARGVIEARPAARRKKTQRTKGRQLDARS
jgi:AcrR family transcriptional regulator